MYVWNLIRKYTRYLKMEFSLMHGDPAERSSIRLTNRKWFNTAIVLVIGCLITFTVCLLITGITFYILNRGSDSQKSALKGKIIKYNLHLYNYCMNVKEKNVFWEITIVIGFLPEFGKEELEGLVCWTSLKNNNRSLHTYVNCWNRACLINIQHVFPCTGY